MEKYPKVTCEVCGCKELIDTKEAREVYKSIDLWICDHCAYTFSFIMAHIRMANEKVPTTEGLEHLDNIIKEMERRARLFPLESGLPKISINITNKPEQKNRLDSLIVDEDIQ